MCSRLLAVGWVVVLLGPVFCHVANAQAPNGNGALIENGDVSQAKRHFRFHYNGTIRDLPTSAKVRVWIPMAQSGDRQEIGAVKWQLPMEPSIEHDNEYGNQMLYLEMMPSGETDLPFAIEYDVVRHEVNGLPGSSRSALDQSSRARYLKADRLVPIDGRPLELLQSLSLPGEQLAIARQLYQRVDQHMTYDKSIPGYGNGDSVWACESQTGNCTDFHSLFISLARSQNIPARFEIGFPLPADSTKGAIAGYHCWASFYVDGKGWIPVDISEADKHPELKGYYFGNLSPHRVAFSVGRDVSLEPVQNGAPLNYFVYPYVEVDGSPWPQDKIELALEFEDVDDVAANGPSAPADDADKN